MSFQTPFLMWLETGRSLESNLTFYSSDISSFAFSFEKTETVHYGEQPKQWDLLRNKHYQLRAAWKSLNDASLGVYALASFSILSNFLGKPQQSTGRKMWQYFQTDQWEIFSTVFEYFFPSWTWKITLGWVIFLFCFGTKLLFPNSARGDERKWYSINVSSKWPSEEMSKVFVGK